MTGCTPCFAEHTSHQKRRSTTAPAWPVAGEDTEVGTACLDQLTGCGDEPVAVSASALRLVGDDGAEPAGGVAPAVMGNLFGQDVQGCEHDLVVEEEHGDRMQRWVMRARRFVTIARPYLVLERKRLRA